VSPELAARQRATIARAAPDDLGRVEWLRTLPERVDGAIVLNEVLDAVPPSIVSRIDGAWREQGVVVRDDGALALSQRPLTDARLRALAEARFPAGDYTSELNPAAEALIEHLGRRLASGAMLVVDYGFPRAELYHPQRTRGTLMGHYRHRAHGDPLRWPGLTDLTAHVDFTAIAEAGERAGLTVAGFASQAAFLLASGLLERLADVGSPESAAYLREAAAVQTLTSPAEMGELFKVLALARSDGIAWPGFALADMTHRL
jgi:SAM-dependent MidA family methyltransferase